MDEYRRNMYFMQRFSRSILAVSFVAAWMLTLCLILLKAALSHSSMLTVDVTYYLTSFGMIIFRGMGVNKCSMAVHVGAYLLSLAMTCASIFYDEGDKYHLMHYQIHYTLIAIYVIQIVAALLACGRCPVNRPEKLEKAVNAHCFIGLLTFVLHSWIFVLQVYLWHWLIVVVGQLFTLAILFIMLTPYFEASQRMPRSPTPPRREPRDSTKSVRSVFEARRSSYQQHNLRRAEEGRVETRSNETRSTDSEEILEREQRLSSSSRFYK